MKNVNDEIQLKKSDILEIFHARHACREFDSARTIPEDDFLFLLEVARLSPSSFGLEPWKFLVCQKKEYREAILEAFWGGEKQFSTASHLVFALARKSHFMHFNSDYVLSGMRDIMQLPEDIRKYKAERYKIFQEKDFDLLSSDRAMLDWATRQLYLPLANMMTAATMIGIDTCPMEGYNRKEAEKLLAETLGMDTEKFGLAYGLAFGYRIKEPRKKTRRPISEIVEWFE